jgi:hypothetical protein
MPEHHYPPSTNGSGIGPMAFPPTGEGIGETHAAMPGHQESSGVSGVQSGVDAGPKNKTSTGPLQGGGPKLGPL